MKLTATIINDCRDENAKARLVSRVSSLFCCPVSFVGVNSEIEAAGNLIDTLDAYDERPGVILVNVAPRNGKGKNFSNGTPFGYIRYKNILVVSTIDGLTLSLVKKLDLAGQIMVIDLRRSLPVFSKVKFLSSKDLNRIENTQFRSYEFQPKAAKYLLSGKTLPSHQMSIESVSNPPNTIWWIDNFGNCKTTLVESDYKFTFSGKQSYSLDTNLGQLAYHQRLKDVPDNSHAIVTGSSGIENRRFLEIVAQGKSAAQELNLKNGDEFNVISAKLATGFPKLM